MNRKTFWLSVLLIVLASSSIIFMLTRDNVSVNTKEQSGGINAFMTNAVYTQFNKLGQLQTRMQTPNMEHYAKHDTSFFVKPTILIYTSDRIPWYVKSDYGKSQNGTIKVYLWGSVVLHQPQMIDHPETTIYTKALTVYPKRSFAETNEDVTIHRPGSVVKGKGVTANFKTGIIKLLTESRGIYEPTDEVDKTKNPLNQTYSNLSKRI